MKYVHHKKDKRAFYKVLYAGIKVSVLKKVDNLQSCIGSYVVCRNNEVMDDYIK